MTQLNMASTKPEGDKPQIYDREVQVKILSDDDRCMICAFPFYHDEDIFEQPAFEAFPSTLNPKTIRLHIICAGRMVQ